ncbi:uncharacterized protein PAC_05903 [Phialocephala subalpina]|uniref:Uncharacterized protein n=1 Tax=Phialocephala subalpina TaxID=576137 RepID=A0A1L7WTA4_9HELO|nr:uncharacterized protein PAC_05903 [Phialocephala subalpina]
MSDLKYNIALGVDEISRRLGVGAFEVSENWKCPACHNAPTKHLCTDCKASYLHEVSNLSYTDAYERRLDYLVGTSGLVMGICAGLLNASLMIWAPGPFLSSLTEAISARLPTWLFSFLAEGAVPRTIYNFALLTVSLGSASMLGGAMVIAMFLMGANPRGERHWRHMTLGAWVMLLMMGAVYTVVLVMGVKIKEILFVVGPSMMGCVGFGAVACMRKSVEGEGKGREDLLKDVEEGKGS